MGGITPSPSVNSFGNDALIAELKGHFQSQQSINSTESGTVLHGSKNNSISQQAASEHLEKSQARTEDASGGPWSKFKALVSSVFRAISEAFTPASRSHSQVESPVYEEIDAPPPKPPRTFQTDPNAFKQPFNDGSTEHQFENPIYGDGKEEPIYAQPHSRSV